MNVWTSEMILFLAPFSCDSFFVINTYFKRRRKRRFLPLLNHLKQIHFFYLNYDLARANTPYIVIFFWLCSNAFDGDEL